MQKPKTTKTRKPATPPRTKQSPRPATPPPPAPLLAAAAPTPAISEPATKPPAPKRAARLHRATLTHAGMRGRDLVRFLRLHTKHPYGKRGEEAIRKLAIEVGHLGNIELDKAASVAEK